MNLPPFYIGQKIICVSTTWHKIKKFLGFDYKSKVHGPKYNETCLVSGIFFNNGFHCVSIEGYPANSIYTCKDFRPLEQTRFPKMTFKEIEKVEKEEILILN